MEPILEKTLANSLNIKITDHSRLIAADRWFVKIVCSVIMNLTDENFADSNGDDDPVLCQMIRQRLGDQLNMELVQERNFIDAEARDEVTRDLLARISENMTDYLSAEAFPGRFFGIRYDEARKACLIDMAQGVDNRVEKNDEPVDFSACFRD